MLQLPGNIPAVKRILKDPVRENPPVCSEGNRLLPDRIHAREVYHGPNVLFQNTAGEDEGI